jgi:signal transduction histidine kinase
MLANLIDNALHHCPKGTLITLVLSNNPAPQLTIADNGPGIPEAERDNVFRRFYRLERARSTPGHGLGLSVVSAIAELHGASITLADNQPGLRVQVLFPPLKARDYEA